MKAQGEAGGGGGGGGDKGRQERQGRQGEAGEGRRGSNEFSDGKLVLPSPPASQRRSKLGCQPDCESGLWCWFVLCVQCWSVFLHGMMLCVYPADVVIQKDVQREI